MTLRRYLIRLTVRGLGLLLLPATLAAQPANLLVNPGFESGTLVPWEAGPGAVITPSLSHSGQFGVQVRASEMVSQGWVAVVPGRTYIVTAWFRWSRFEGGGWGYDTIGVVNDQWTDEASMVRLHERYERDRWHKVALVFAPRSTRIRVRFGVYGPKDQVDLAFDDVTLAEKEGNRSPVVAPTASAPTGAAPFAVTFSAQADDPDGAVAIHRWDFGDGALSMVQNPSHVFTQAGTYDVTLTVWDNEGATASGQLRVTVSSSSQPRITITSPTSEASITTSASAISIGGDALASTGRQITNIVWDNVSTDEAAEVPLTAGASLGWQAASVELKPGTNEVLVTATDSAGEVATARVFVTRTIAAPTIGDVSVSASEVRLYEKYEVRFSVHTFAGTPFFTFDPSPPPGVPPGDGVTVEAVISTPAGHSVRQPAFYTREVTRRGDGGQAVFVEGPRAYWAVRFSPTELGEHRVSLHVQDATGTAEATVGTFVATAPTRKGFVRVSREDRRYFELDSGELFWPTGPVHGPDYASYRGSGLNLERPWMAGEAAYSTNFARWMRVDLRLGNEGFDNPLTFSERYPSHELAREITWPGAHRIWMGPWLDRAYTQPLKAGTTYQLKLRIKTSELSGPSNASGPSGLVLKNHGWPTDTLEADIRSQPSMLPPVTTNRPWHTIVARYVATPQDETRPYLSLYLDNVSSGRVFIDEFSMREIRPDGSLGGELVRHAHADLHTYVESRPAAFFDWQVEEGAANGVFFKYVLQDKRDWVPAHLSRFGVFTESGDGYFQPDGTKAKWLQQQWWRYVVARWGYATAVHSWELCNEADPNDPAVYRHAQDLAKFMHENDAHGHLVTTSFWCCWKPDFWSDRTAYPDVDYADLHYYTGDGDDGLDVASLMLSYASMTSTPSVGKPVMLAEVGVGQPGQRYFEALRQPNPGVWFHNLLWAQLGAGSGLSAPGYWWSEHLGQVDIRQIAAPFAAFLSGLPLNKGGFVDAAATVSGDAIRAAGQKNLPLGSAHLWIHNKRHTWSNVMGIGPAVVTPVSGTVTLVLSPGRSYRVEWWDTYTGSRSESIMQSDAAGAIALPVTNLRNDVAVKISDPTTGRPGAPRSLRRLR